MNLMSNGRYTGISLNHGRWAGIQVPFYGTYYNVEVLLVVHYCRRYYSILPKPQTLNPKP